MKQRVFTNESPHLVGERGYSSEMVLEIQNNNYNKPRIL